MKFPNKLPATQASRFLHSRQIVLSYITSSHSRALAENHSPFYVAHVWAKIWQHHRRVLAYYIEISVVWIEVLI